MNNMQVHGRVRNCYLSRCYKGFTGAGSKARADIETIMDRLGFVNIGIRRTLCRNSVKSFLLNLYGVLKASFKLGKGDNLVLQYPLSKFFTFLCAVSRIKGARCIVFIHDLNSLRVKHMSVGQEIRKISRADVIITGNEKMSAWLKKNGCNVVMHELGVFDYLSGKRCPGQRNRCRDRFSIVYAGALNRRKNAFLYDLENVIDGRFIVSLYGSGFDMNAITNRQLFSYKGFVDSEELISGADGDYGLVWDGDSVDTCSGDFGEYLAINTPHKVSLYIKCGIPLIIWSGAAMAGFVADNGIGICVDSLADLPSVLSGITDDKYEEMRKNVLTVERKISGGEYFSNALKQSGIH